MDETPQQVLEDRSQRARPASRTRGRLAEFELLADPDSIAGTPRPLAPGAAPPPGPGERAAPLARSPRLDLAAASALAREARRRSEASRQALAEARRRLAGTETADETEETAELEPSGWRRRPLAAADGRTGNEPVHARGVAPDAGADRYELPELRAALEIARETGRGQQQEIAELRARREQDADELARHARALDEARAEIAALRERVGERERELASRGRREAELHDRLEVQSAALGRARQEFAEERRRHTASQQLLERLRSAIEEAAPAIDATRPAPAQADREPTEASPTAEAFESTRALRAEQHARPMWPASEALPGIYDAWLDEQVRRHFGPMGLEGFAELVCEALEPETEASTAPGGIALLGAGCSALAAPLAARLAERPGTPPRLHVVDPTSDEADRAADREGDRGAESPIEWLETPGTPDDLLRALELRRPRLVVSRQLLSQQADPRPWIAALEVLQQRGSSLLLVERTGLGRDDAPAEMVEVGERIWELMPDRTKRDPDSGEPIASWAEAFAATAEARARGAFDLLRESFRFELAARFGHLAEPFVASPLARHLEPERDRRFLSQIADLDDRRIEAGAAPPLHGLAWVRGVRA